MSRRPDEGRRRARLAVTTDAPALSVTPPDGPTEAKAPVGGLGALLRWK
ncbi:hypothetical protein AB0I77_17035 [Streptomyces sp. NPDC050619]